jgi:thiosulfate/3-mercaptopyruvate sulfurtransferase
MNPNAPQPPVLIEAVEAIQAAARGDDILLLDCRFELSDVSAGERAHVASHPNGAVYAHLDRDLSSPKGNNPLDPNFSGRHPLPDPAAWAATVARWGVKQSTTVVCFDAHGSPYASRAWWLFRWLGHAKVMVLNGGLDAWVRAGGAISTQATPPRAAAAPMPMQTAGMPVIDAPTLMARLSALRLIDARGADRFRGENETMDPIAGHIPGAVNRCFRDNLAADGRFKSNEVLTAEWQPLLSGVPSEHLVQQCGSGVTACQNILALMHLGHPPTTLYPGSWSEWSADPKRPRATG